MISFKDVSNLFAHELFSRDEVPEELIMSIGPIMCPLVMLVNPPIKVSAIIIIEVIRPSMLQRGHVILWLVSPIRLIMLRFVRRAMVIIGRLI